MVANCMVLCWCRDSMLTRASSDKMMQLSVAQSKREAEIEVVRQKRVFVDQSAEHGIKELPDGFGFF